MIKKLRKKLNGDVHLKDLLKGSVITFFLKMGGMLLSYVLIYTISKKFGAEGVGEFNLFSQILTVLSMLVGLGLNITVLRYVGEFNNSQNSPKMHLLYKNFIKLVSPSSIFIGIAFFVFSNELSSLIYDSNDKSFFFRILGLSLPFFAVNQISVEFIRGLKKLQISELIRSVLRPLVILILIFAYDYKNLSTDNLLVMFFVGTLLNSIISSFSIWKNLKKTPKDLKVSFSTSELLKTSFPIMAVSVSTALLTAVPIFVLDFFGTRDELGIFTVSYKLSQIVTVILLIINTMSAPKFAELFWANKISELQKLLIQSSKIMFWIALFFSLILILFSTNILSLFGGEFVHGSAVLSVLVIGQLINAATGSVGVLLNMSGNQKIYRRVILIVVSIFIITCPIATIIFGMLGTAITTSFSVILINIWLVVIVRKKLNIRTSFPL